MGLPLFHSDDKDLSLLQTKWKSQLDPMLGKPTNQSLILKNQALISGTTVINHLLGRDLQGWNIVRKRSGANIYDAQDSNQHPQLTLVLISDAAVICDIEVF